MKHMPFATLLKLLTLACLKPDRCPYCPADAPAHWIIHGSYERYAGDPDPLSKVDVTRHFCKVVGRTFSLPPDALLPYCRLKTCLVLQLLHALLVESLGVRTLARRFGVGRGALRYFRVRFLRTLAKLRFPWHEGALDAAGFLASLSRQGAAAVAELFRSWKQQEPKLSIVGIYLR